MLEAGSVSTSALSCATWFKLSLIESFNTTNVVLSLFGFAFEVILSLNYTKAILVLLVSLDL